MFEICNDKTYFLAETTAKNKTIEITLVKDSHITGRTTANL